MLELVFFKVPSHTDTVHVAEDATEAAFIRYPGEEEIVAGTPVFRKSPCTSTCTYMYINMHVMKS